MPVYFGFRRFQKSRSSQGFECGEVLDLGGREPVGDVGLTQKSEEIPGKKLYMQGKETNVNSGHPAAVAQEEIMGATPLRLHRSGVSRAVLIAVALSLMGGSVRATTLIHIQELRALVEESDGAALVRVTGVRYGLDERDLHSTFVTLEVEDPVYGSRVLAAGREMTIKTYGAPLTMPDGSRMSIDGTPRYRVGERYLLLLTRESEWGFSSTAGLFQGVFHVARDARGGLHARNLAGTERIVGKSGLTPAERPSDAVSYSLLRSTLVSLWTDLGREPRQSSASSDARLGNGKDGAR